MLNVDISVTKAPTYLEQIDQIGIQNLGLPAVRGLVQYRVTRKGRYIGFCWHRPEDGALRLVAMAATLVADKEIKK